MYKTMSTFAVVLFIITLVLFILAFRRIKKIRGGISTSWRDDRYAPLVDNITEVIKKYIKNDNYNYNAMRDEVVCENEYQKRIVSDLFYELEKVKIDKYRDNDVEGKGAFAATFTGIVEAYVHLYVVHGIKLELEDKIYAGTFNIVIVCNKNYVLRIRARSYNPKQKKANKFNKDVEPHEATNEILKQSILEHRRVLDAFKYSNRILKPICSSYFLYHDFSRTLIVEWSYNDRVESAEDINPIIVKNSLSDYIECLLETNRIAHSVGLTYIDYKIYNIQWNPVTECYCITDIDFERADQNFIFKKHLTSHRIPDTFQLGKKLKYVSNYIILKEVASIIKAQNSVTQYKSYAYYCTENNDIASIIGREYDIANDDYIIEDSELETKINHILEATGK